MPVEISLWIFIINKYMYICAGVRLRIKKNIIPDDVN